MSSRIDRRVRIALSVTICVAAVLTGFAQSRRTLVELGRVDPPAYAAPLMRSGESSAVFDDAMAAYGRRRFDESAERLRRFVAVEPDDAAANFFLAVSLMMTDDVGEAEDRLNAVLSASETPFTVPARFVLAKALIRLGRLDAAEGELGRAAAADGPYARLAAELLPKVRAARKRE